MGLRGPKPPEPEQVARVLVDAEALGDSEAARQHGLSRNTVAGWRAKYGQDENVEQHCATLRRAISKTWLRRAKEVRRIAVDRLAELIQNSAELSEVTDALKALHEVVTSHEVLRGPSKRSDPKRPASSTQSPTNGKRAD